MIVNLKENQINISTENEMLELLEMIRPHGIWKDIYSSHIAYACSSCKRQLPVVEEFRFCPFCGSKNEMKQG